MPLLSALTLRDPGPAQASWAGPSREGEGRAMPSQGSRIRPVYPYDRFSGGSEVSPFTQPSGVRGAAMPPKLAPSIGSQTFMREPWMPSESFLPGFESRDVETAGARIHLVLGGSGPPLLLLHGHP